VKSWFGVVFGLLSQFFNYQIAEASAEAIKKLNPLVTVKTDPSPLADKEESFFHQFHVVCMSGELQIYFSFFFLPTGE